MKRIYLFSLLALMASTSFAQIGAAWFQFLPLDFEDNLYERDSVMVMPIEDADITGAANLDAYWGEANDDFKYVIDGWTNQTARDFSGADPVNKPMPEQDSADFYAQYMLMAGETALYVLYNVTDDEVLPADGDGSELGFAHYGGKFDPGRTIYPDVNHFRWDADSNKYKFGGTYIPGETYVEMAKYGLWTSEGAYKVGVPLESNAALSANCEVYSLLGANEDTLGDVTGGVIPEPIQTVFETKSGGYYLLTVVPWTLMAGNKLEVAGDDMSIAPKINDFDSNNETYVNNNAETVTHRYDYWGSTDQNNVYFAIAYYGAVATLAEPLTSIAGPDRSAIKAYFNQNTLYVAETVRSYTVEIYDIKGSSIQTIEVAGGQRTISLESLQSGLYVADIRDAEGNRGVLKFMKQ